MDKMLLAVLAGVLLYLVLIIAGVVWGWRWAGGIPSFWLRVLARGGFCALAFAPSFMLGGERGFPAPAWIAGLVALVSWDAYTGLPALKSLAACWAGFSVFAAIVSKLTGR